MKETACSVVSGSAAFIIEFDFIALKLHYNPLRFEQSELIPAILIFTVKYKNYFSI